MKPRFTGIFSFLAFFLASPLILHAQVKVDSTGALSIGRNAIRNSMITLGDNAVNPSIGESGISIVLHGKKAQNNIKKCYYGIYSNISGNVSGQSPSIGVMGHVSFGPNGKRYGVVGSVISGQNGAGVYGTADGSANTRVEPMDGSYAGYFAGPTYVKGTLTATEVITPSDITLKENIISIEEEEETVGSTLDNLMNMNVIKYTYKPQPVSDDQEEDELDAEERLLLGSKVQTQNNLLQMSQQKHYGLSAQEIREIYPDVVREGQNGTLGVNYIELVPILIRSIQELKAELNELKGVETKPMMARAMTVDEDETTDIHFTLPENIKDASVYVFDMSGKMRKQVPVSSSMDSFSIEGQGLPAGMYICSLVIDGKEVKTRRMILTK